MALLAIGVCLGVFTWAALLRSVNGASQQKSKRPHFSALPKIKNCVSHVKLVNARLEDWGESQVAVFELENQAYVGVTSLSIEQIYKGGSNAVIESGFSPDKEPLIIIPPGGRKTAHIGNLEANSLIRIGSVMFSDGTEEGCASSLKEAREIKDRDTKKGGPKK